MNSIENTKQLVPYRPLELMRDKRITKFDCTDFIGVWENFIPASFCDRLIEFGDGVLSGDHSSIVNPDDVEIMDGSSMYGGICNRHDTSFLLNYASDKFTYQINQFLKSCVLHYVHEFPQLSKLGMVSTDIKFQKTPPGGGYHLWHYENASFYFAQRELTWMVYLNDLGEDDGGETEFQYQRKRIRPTKGTVVVWPAGMTHVHKGNLVLGDKTKYIVTGWYIKTGAN